MKSISGGQAAESNKKIMDSNGLYLLFYFCIILYFVVLGCYMLTSWHAITPVELTGRLPIYIAAVLVVADMAFLCIRYIKEYRIYLQRMSAEYSETTGNNNFSTKLNKSRFFIQTADT